MDFREVKMQVIDCKFDNCLWFLLPGMMLDIVTHSRNNDEKTENTKPVWLYWYCFHIADLKLYGKTLYYCGLGLERIKVSFFQWILKFLKMNRLFWDGSPITEIIASTIAN